MSVSLGSASEGAPSIHECVGLEYHRAHLGATSTGLISVPLCAQTLVQNKQAHCGQVASAIPRAPPAVTQVRHVTFCKA